jgi:hypothetical protein
MSWCSAVVLYYLFLFYMHCHVIINKEFMFSYIRFSFCDMTVMFFLCIVYAVVAISVRGFV